MSEPPHTTCACGNEQPVKRKIGTGAGIIFKGGGFYETDFKEKKGSADTAPKSDDAKTATSEKKSDASAAETAKPAAKSESAPAKPTTSPAT